MLKTIAVLLLTFFIIVVGTFLTKNYDHALAGFWLGNIFMALITLILTS